MPENNAATPLPPDAGGLNPAPNLTVVPPVVPTSPRESGLTKKQIAELTLAVDLITEGRKPVYNLQLEKEGVNLPYLDALAQACEALIVRGQNATNRDSDRRGATLSKNPAVRKLLGSLRRIQARARAAYLPAHPEKLANYHVGESLARRDVLQTKSQQIINQATTDRPGSTDTVFINQVRAERTDAVAASQAQKDRKDEGSQERSLRDQEFADIQDRRRKIQYAADAQWPAGNPANVAARKAFKLPKNKAFSAV